MRLAHNIIILQIVIILSILIFTSGCSTIEVIDGLCYNDKDGTHICEKQEVPSEPIDRWELCKPWMTHDPETWQNCMMIA